MLLGHCIYINGITSRASTAYPSEQFLVGFVLLSSVFVEYCLCCPFVILSFGLCIVCTPKIYAF